MALARAFVVKTALLFADHPTSRMDFATGERVLELMFNLNGLLGTILLLVTHDRACASLGARCITIEASD